MSLIHANLCPSPSRNMALNEALLMDNIMASQPNPR